MKKYIIPAVVGAISALTVVLFLVSKKKRHLRRPKNENKEKDI